MLFLKASFSPIIDSAGMLMGVAIKLNSSRGK